MRTKLFFAAAFAAITISNLQKANAQSWLLAGNSNATTKSKLGTLDGIPLIFWTNNKERMRIDTSGNVGIGTVNPATRLDVLGGRWDVSNTEGDFRIGNSAYRMKVGVATSGGGAGDIRIRAVGGTNRLLFGSNTFEVLAINGSGNVGIGTITPVYKLDMIGEARIHSACSGNSCSPALVIEQFDGYGGPAVSIGKTIGDGIDVSTSSGEAIQAYSHNDVGIQASSTNAVGLAVTISNNGGAAYFGGDINVNGTIVHSDSTLKRNITNVSNAIAIIKQLQPKQYQYRNDGNYKLMNLPQGSHFGLIAQDVEKILPNLVKESKFETKWAKPNPTPEDVKNSETIKFKGLNYTELIPLLIKGLQEQQALIDTQQQQINELKQQMKIVSGSVHNSKKDKSSSTVITTSAAGAYLDQNIPNPFSNGTTIGYYIPERFSQAQLQITDMAGGVLKMYSIVQSGYGRQSISTNTLTSGMYEYSLWVDGKRVDTKQLMLTK